MAGSISEFKSSFTTDIARPNKFDVEIPIPLGLIPYLGISRNLNMRCETAELPGRTLATLEQKYYGPAEKYPYTSLYGDAVLTFIVSDNMREKLFFDAWLDYINPNYNFDLKYKGDYSVPIRINQYDVTNKASYSVDLIDAYPSSINQLDLDWSADGHHKLSVTFSYTYWRNNSVEALAMQAIEAGTDATLDLIFGLSGLNGSGVNAGIGMGLGKITGTLNDLINRKP